MVAPERSIASFIHHESWWKNRGILVLNLTLILPLLSSAVVGFDSSTLNGLQILPSWQEFFHDPDGQALGLINSAQWIGALSGTPFAPFFSDRIGRRATVVLGSIIMVVGVLTQGLAQTVHVFIGARIIVGFGLAFCSNAAPLLITELTYPTQRGKVVSLYNCLWYLGSTISAWICLGAYDSAGQSDWSWRAPLLVQAVVPVLQIALVWFIPESPRWLVAKGLESRAARVLAKYHANGGDERDQLVVFEMAQIRHALKLERDASRTYRTCFATAGNRRRMLTVIGIAVFSQWSGNGLVSYYINIVLEDVGISSTRTKAAINGGLQVFNLACAITGAMLVDKLGRKKVFVISNVGMLITFSMWTLTTALFENSNNGAAAKATVPLIFIYFFFYDFAYTPLLVSYTLEILPFKIRAQGFAIMTFTVSATVAFNQFVNPWALKAIGWKYYLVYCGWLVLELLFVLVFVIETRGRTLEETAALFDCEREPQDTVETGGEATTMIIEQQQSQTNNSYSNTGTTYPHATYPSYPRPPHSEKDLCEEYFELQAHSTPARSRIYLDSQSEESAIVS